MAKFRKLSPTTVPNLLASQLLPQPHMMLIFFHCLATGASVNECLHFYNQTLTDWCSKKQATVETARYGSEFAAAKTATEQIMDLRYTLRYLDVPTSLTPTSILPHSTLSKKNNILAFCRVREPIAAKLIYFHWI